VQPVEDTEAGLKAKELYESGKYAEAEKLVEEVFKAGKQNKSIYKLRANLFFQREMFNKAADLFAEYLDLFPEETEFLYQAAISYKLSNKLESAADYSERLKLREPRNFQNLILLAEIYFDLKIFGRAKGTLENAALIEPNHPKIKELKTKFSSI
jgi:tetratricopeptide (TPR) repeat protein